MTTKTIPLTAQSAQALETIRQSGDFDGAMYAIARTLSLVDQVGIHLDQAGLAPANRDDIPEKVSNVLSALAYTKRILAQIQRIAVEQDSIEDQRTQAMARCDQMRVTQLNIQACELRQTLHHLCRSFDVQGDDDEN